MRRKYCPDKRPVSRGYIEVYLPTHPNSNKTGYVLEHRLTMEKHLGRTLLSTETVHHIDGDPSNNRIENLMLCSEHKEHMKEHRKKHCKYGHLLEGKNVRTRKDNGKRQCVECLRRRNREQRKR